MNISSQQKVVVAKFENSSSSNFDSQLSDFVNEFDNQFSIAKNKFVAFFSNASTLISIFFSHCRFSISIVYVENFYRLIKDEIKHLFFFILIIFECAIKLNRSSKNSSSSNINIANFTKHSTRSHRLINAIKLIETCRHANIK